MIENFEEITQDLTEVELRYASFIALELMKHLRPGVTIKQPELCKLINGGLVARYGLFNQMKINNVRLRKYFNYFRSKGQLPIIATSDGCSISYDPDIIRSQIHSLEQRARSILLAANGMKTFV